MVEPLAARRALPAVTADTRAALTVAATMALAVLWACVNAACCAAPAFYADADDRVPRRLVERRFGGDHGGGLLDRRRVGGKRASTAEPLHCLRLPPRHAPSITGAMLRTRRLAAVLARVARISGVADARSGDALPVAVAHKMTCGRGRSCRLASLRPQ